MLSRVVEMVVVAAAVVEAGMRMPWKTYWLKETLYHCDHVSD